MLVAVWSKRWDEENQCFYYYNNVTEEMRWEAPLAFAMFFPQSSW